MKSLHGSTPDPPTQPSNQKKFPPANRLGAEAQSQDTLRKTIQSASTVAEAVRDFSLLLYLMDFREMFDWEYFMPRVCRAVIFPMEDLEEGDKIMIRSVAQLD
jgi:hypothetical protein